MKYIVAICILTISIVSCVNQRDNNQTMAGKTVTMLDKLPGSFVHTTLGCREYLDSKEMSYFSLEESSSPYLFIYLDETMCTSCIEEALGFFSNELSFIPLNRTRIITRYTNIRTPSIFLKLNKIEIPFCNVSEVPFQENFSGFDKPLFLVVNSSSRILEYFQLKDKMKKRMRAAIQFLRIN